MANAYIVRHGAMRQLGEFTPRDEEQVYSRGDQVVIKSKRGIEIGEILCEASERSKRFLKDPTSGDILRPIKQSDLEELHRLQEREKNEFATCVEFIKNRKLQMELIDVEHLLTGDRIIFYFLAKPPDRRVDFRELVRDLAREYQTRIEMRQIGIRDEAKLLADYGDCGKPVCCNTHMTVMPPVSMRMAKLQKSTLDPAKISGRCGRLKCCLRFEHDIYEENNRSMPEVGNMILTQDGKCRVLSLELLMRKLVVEYEDGRRVMIDADDILTSVKN